MQERREVSAFAELPAELTRRLVRVCDAVVLDAVVGLIMIVVCYFLVKITDPLLLGIDHGAAVATSALAPPEHLTEPNTPAAPQEPLQAATAPSATTWGQVVGYRIGLVALATGPGYVALPL